MGVEAYPPSSTLWSGYEFRFSNHQRNLILAIVFRKVSKGGTEIVQVLFLNCEDPTRILPRLGWNRMPVEVDASRVAFHHPIGVTTEHGPLVLRELVIAVTDEDRNRLSHT